MKNSVYSPHYDKLRVWLKNKRVEKGLTLRDLSTLTGIHHSIFGKIEQGRRRIDLVEFVEYCQALEADPKEGICIIVSSIEGK